MARIPKHELYGFPVEEGKDQNQITPKILLAWGFEQVDLGEDHPFDDYALKMGDNLMVGYTFVDGEPQGLHFKREGQSSVSGVAANTIGEVSRYLTEALRK